MHVDIGKSRLLLQAQHHIVLNFNLYDMVQSCLTRGAEGSVGSKRPRV
jgi:hypothetical protein